MYKSTSRAMKHATRIDLIHPSKGYIAGQNDDGDPLLSPEAMTRAQLDSENAQLRLENQRWSSELAAARAAGDERRASGIGLTMQTLQQRASIVGAEIKRRNIARSGRVHVEFKRLIKERLGEDEFVALSRKAEELAFKAVA